MRPRATFFILFFAVSLLTIPLFAHANSIPFFGPVIPPENPLCPAGWGMLIIVINNIILLLLTLAIVFLAPLMIAYSGFLFVWNPVDPNGIKKAKDILTNTIVGIVIALAGWMIVDALMAVLYNGSFGSWSSIITSGGAAQCLDQKGALPGAVPTSAPGVTVVAPGPGGAAATSISTAASAYTGASTAAGPGGGRLACAWAVNQVLTNAGIAPIDGSSVAAMESALQGGRGTLINQSTAMPGDIVIEAGDGHVGICQNAGCSQVLSNSSSKASFSWMSGPDFAPSYSNGQGRIYHVTS